MVFGKIALKRTGSENNLALSKVEKSANCERSLKDI